MKYINLKGGDAIGVVVIYVLIVWYIVDVLRRFYGSNRRS